ncbi:4631_t:CDS:2, partial [Acaulospora colombiana]
MTIVVWPLKYCSSTRDVNGKTMLQIVGSGYLSNSIEDATGNQIAIYDGHPLIIKRHALKQQSPVFTGTSFTSNPMSGVSAAFYPHGLGHSLGMDVHDVPSASKPSVNKTIPSSSTQNPEFYRYLRLRLPLEANMVVLAPVRNSPYIDHGVLSRYEDVGGVRIEDVVLITKTGCDVLTTVRKDIEWLESVAS